MPDPQLEKDSPAAKDAQAIFVRALISVPFFTAAGNDSPTSLIDSKANTFENRKASLAT
jgi:hypothetical protein